MQEHFNNIRSELIALLEYKKGLNNTIGQELIYNGFQFKKYYANSFQINKNGVILEVTYHHLCATHGGQKDEDGDLIDVFPFRITFDDSCDSCHAHHRKEIKAMTERESVNIIREQIIKHECNKRQKTEYDIDQFCADILLSLEAIRKHSEFAESFERLRSAFCQ